MIISFPKELPGRMAAALLGLALLLAAACSFVTGAKPVTASTLSQLYHDQAFAEAAELGRAAVRKGGAAPELIAWLALNEARANRKSEGLARATELRAKEPGSPWGAFAIAGALIYDDEKTEEALKASAQALAADPDRIEFIWMRAETLRLRHKLAEARALLVEARARGKDSFLFHVVEGKILFDQMAPDAVSKERVANALAPFDRAERMAPDQGMPSYTAGWYLASVGEAGDAVAYFAKAAALSESAHFHAVYWGAVSETPRLTQERKRELIRADVQRFLRTDSPQRLAAGASAYWQVGLDDEAEAAADRLRRKYPNTIEAGQTEYERIVRAREKADGLAPDLRRRLHALTRAPALQGTPYPEGAYRLLATAPPTSASEARDIARGLVRTAAEEPGAYAQAALLLADGASDAARSEATARAGLARLPAYMRSLGGQAPSDYESVLSGALHDALGWALVRQGRFDEATAALTRAHTLAPNNPQVMYHLGKSHELSRDYAAAETWYIRGASLPATEANPCMDALRGLYVLRTGNAANFDAYFRRRAGEISRARTARIEEARLANPELVSFRLRTLSGGVVSTDDLHGKIVVVSFWALWCGPCKVELPDIQQLSRRYQSHDVVFLTVFDGKNAEGTRKWAEENAVTLPILDGAPFMRGAGVMAVPTTWFLDKTGRRVFEMAGYSPNSQEEFTTRIEALQR